MTLHEAKRHLGLTAHDHDDAVRDLIWSAAKDLEQTARITLTPKTFKLTLDQFPGFGCPIQLEYPPIASVTSIDYYDRDAVQQSINVADTAEVQIRTSTVTQGEIYPGTDDVLWPDTQIRRLAAVEIVYVAGYADQESVPELARQYLKIWIRQQFDNPDGYMTPQVARGLTSLADQMWSGTFADADIYPT